MSVFPDHGGGNMCPENIRPGEYPPRDHVPRDYLPRRISASRDNPPWEDAPGKICASRDDPPTEIICPGALFLGKSKNTFILKVSIYFNNWRPLLNKTTNNATGINFSVIFVGSNDFDMTLVFTSLNVCDDLILCKGFFHLDSIQLDCRNPFVLGSASKTSLYIHSRLEMVSLSKFYINTFVQCYYLDRIDRFIQCDLKIFLSWYIIFVSWWIHYWG